MNAPRLPCPIRRGLLTMIEVGSPAGCWFHGNMAVAGPQVRAPYNRACAGRRETPPRWQGGVRTALLGTEEEFRR